MGVAPPPSAAAPPQSTAQVEYTLSPDDGAPGHELLHQLPSEAQEGEFHKMSKRIKAELKELKDDKGYTAKDDGDGAAADITFPYKALENIPAQHKAALKRLDTGRAPSQCFSEPSHLLSLFPPSAHRHLANSLSLGRWQWGNFARGTAACRG